MKRREMTFLQKSEEVLLIWKDKWLACMVITIHDAAIASTGKEDKRFNEEHEVGSCLRGKNVV